MTKVEDFLTSDEEAEVVEAIRQAEQNTSGEICIHLEKSTSINTTNRAVEVFHKLGMHKTQNRNAVLIYIAVKDKQFAIYGDENINKKVPDNFWDSTRDIILKNLKKNNNKQALVEGIIMVGNQLKHHFSYNENDTNELPNDITKS